ncbi:MAG TPA: hypothetical protein DDY91_01930 [Planctomycetaceae bacterium]|nr:hypothetical protein [Planctomycetaceae bacterium]
MDLALPEDPIAAWQVSLQQLGQGHTDVVLAQGFGPRCGLLAAAQAAQRHGRQSELLERIRPADWCERLEKYFGTAQTMQARRLVLLAAFERLDPDQIRVTLRQAIHAYHAAWGLPSRQRWQSVFPTHPADEADPLARLPVQSSASGLSLDEQRFAISASGQGLRRCGTHTLELFLPLVRDFGWLDPALHLVADTWIEIFRPPTRPAAAASPPNSARTWLLLVPEGVESQPGVVYRLGVERRALGGQVCSGVLSPCPWSAAHLRTAESFQSSWRHAWWAAIGRLPARPECDLHWSIRPARDSASAQMVLKDNHGPMLEDRRIFVQIPLSGRSAEAAKICGVQALLNGHRLDDHLAVTAQLANPLTDDLTLAPVGRVADKARADAVWSETRAEAGRERITELLTHRDDPLLHAADAQIDVDPLTQDRHRAFDQGRFVLTGVADVDGCYRRLRRHSQITQALKQRLANRAEVLLRAIGKPYVRTRLFRWIEVNNPEAQRKERKKNWLTADATARFYTGDYPPGETAPRIRLLAESGFGKSTLLIDLEGEIARADDGRVPLRLGAGLTEPPRTGAESPQSQSGNELLPLDDRMFEKNETEVLREIARTIVRPLLSGEDFGDTEIDEWLAEVVKRSEVVWLLDAADQSTTPDLPHLGEFLNSTAARCVAVVTGRPEITQTLPLLWRLQGRAWDELAAGGFGPRNIAEYCTRDLPEDQQNRGREIARRLLARKLWRPLLVPPILAEQMKQLAQQPDGLRGLKNREAIYARTLPKLLDKGLESLKSRGYSPAIKNNWTHATLEEMFGRLAWTMVQAETESDSNQSRLTGAAQGPELEALKQTLTVELDVLWQLGLTVGAVLFDRDGRRETGLAWRHLSFCEYFAGQHLASLPAKEQREVVIAQARNVRWRWILRFALSSAERQARDARSTASQRKQAEARVANLARGLIAGGNPFLLADALRRDRLRLRPATAHLCRWLVHRDWDYRNHAERLPRDAKGQPRLPRVTPQVATDLAGLFDPAHRDSRALHAGWELLERGCRHRTREVLKICQPVSDQFLSEFERLVQQTVRRAERGKSCTARDETVLSLLPEERLVKLGVLSAEALKARRQWSHQLAATMRQHRANYGACPPDGWRHPTDPTRAPLEFEMGSTEYSDEQPRHRVRLTAGFLMGRGPVTNRQFELFDRGHARIVNWQSVSDRLDEHPVVEVTHYQAELFCLWLTGGGRLGRFTLPTEVAWEYACRAGRDRLEDRYGVGNGRELTQEDANFEGTRGRTTRIDEYAPNAWGLCDLHGNVLEWCQDWYDPKWYAQRASNGPAPHPADGGPAVGSSRVVRGGSWYGGVIYCRSAYRSHYDPVSRDYYIGFRVCWRGE